MPVLFWIMLGCTSKAVPVPGDIVCGEGTRPCDDTCIPEGDECIPNEDTGDGDTAE